MIPHTIHYCWFGGKPMPPLAKKCIESWKKYCPDYQIVEWNEEKFDFESNPYAKAAYEAKKWAFVSDYARFKILSEHGGIYFDTDVELVAPIDEIVNDGPFMGMENGSDVNPGVGLGATPHMSIYEEILESYERATFLCKDGTADLTTVVKRTTQILNEHGFQPNGGIQEVCGVKIYPQEYFSPIEMASGKLKLTENTVSIHHFMASWCDKRSVFRGKVYRLLYRCFGEKTARSIQGVLGRK